MDIVRHNTKRFFLRKFAANWGHINVSLRYALSTAITDSIVVAVEVTDL